MPDNSVTVDAVVVGAGPAGSAAALELAKAGRDVILVERGAFPGAKNVYGGVVYGRILDEVRSARLNNMVQGREEELRLAAELAKGIGNPARTKKHSESKSD